MKYTDEEMAQIEQAFAGFDPKPEIIYEDDNDANGEAYARIEPDSEEGFSICKNANGTFNLLESGVVNYDPFEYPSLETALAVAVTFYRETFA